MRTETPGERRPPFTIGVLGGIGPEATGEFYAKLIRRLQASGAVERNERFPRIVVNSIPAPELVNDAVTPTELIPYIEGIRQLDRERPDVIVMVCNTVHLFRGELQRHAAAPILDLREAVRRRLETEGVSAVGILGTRATLAGGLYAYDGIAAAMPDGEELSSLMDCVVRFNRGERREEQAAFSRQVAQRLVDGGAQAILLGCTEFAVMLGGSGLPVIDTIEVLVEETVRRFLEGREG